MNFIYKSFLIFQKDLREEFRTRYTLNTLLLFSIVILAAISFSTGPFSLSSDMKCALLWIILFFSSMSGLPTIFIKEEETHTSGTLKLVVEPACIFMGKLIYNFFLLLCLEMIIIPLFLILMDLQIINLINFTVITLLATLGLSLGGTFIAAIISKASSRNTLFSILSLPILLPVLITGINGTKITLHESQFITINEELKILLAYDIIVTTASFMLFDFIWEE